MGTGFWFCADLILLLARGVVLAAMFLGFWGQAGAGYVCVGGAGGGLEGNAPPPKPLGRGKSKMFVCGGAGHIGAEVVCGFGGWGAASSQLWGREAWSLPSNVAAAAGLLCWVWVCPLLHPWAAHLPRMW